MYELSPLLEARREALMAEADAARLASQLERRPRRLRHDLALVCHRVADWMDVPGEYVRAAETGRQHWVPRSVRL
jgi:hypothetical protein